ncbi:MAG: hypothetical protein PHD21_07815 [Flavobacteriales bacterium]|nr:hypothetical protein [Flavobacteriales bacterium]
MKHLVFKSLSLAVLALAFTSCNGWKELAKDYYTVNPNPLEVKNGQVSYDINGQFPAKVFKKAYALEITPELVYANGTTPFSSVVYQGESFPGNYTVIPFEEGKAVTYTASTPYKADMQQSTLMGKLKGMKGNKTKDLGSIKLAQGVITTALLVEDDFLPAYAPSNFVRDTETSQSGLIHFLVNSWVVRPAQLKNAGYVALCNFVKGSVKDTNIVITSIDFIGHASPEGEATLNENLSIDRAKAVEKYFAEVVKKAKIAGADASGFYSEKGEGADWDGFFDLLANSNISDKDMIKRTLEGEPLLATKEKTLKSLESTYAPIRDQILPDLRRTEVKVNYTIKGRTDEQILALAKSNPSVLTANELIYAAESLTKDTNEQMAILKSAIAVYPNDYRGYNNLGVILWDNGDKAAGAIQLAKAASLEKNAVTNNNCGVMAGAKGDNIAAMQALKDSDVAESAYNQGILNIKGGDYAAAAAQTKAYDSYDSALAQLLNGDNAAAINTLNSLGNDNAKVLYLKAVAYARNGQNVKAKETLAEVAKLDPAMAAAAQKDLEFRNVLK